MTSRVKCFNCKKWFKKRIAEINRSRKRGMRHFCTHKCATITKNKEHPSDPIGARIKLFAGNRTDSLSPFRWFIKVAKLHAYQCNRKLCTLTLQDLIELWDSQQGKCSLTGWKLILPKNTMGWNTGNRLYRASLDRIDNSKGYIKGNVRFIACIANQARGTFSDPELFTFCNAVVNKGSNQQ